MAPQRWTWLFFNFFDIITSFCETILIRSCWFQILKQILTFRVKTCTKNGIFNARTIFFGIMKMYNFFSFYY
jgi:hypothetical protein